MQEKTKKNQTNIRGKPKKSKKAKKAKHSRDISIPEVPEGGVIFRKCFAFFDFFGFFGLPLMFFWFCLVFSNVSFAFLTKS
jgi:hypothetical protein